MSDFFISVVPHNVDKANELADKIVNHLIQRRIIQEGLTNCTPGKPGHPPGDNFREAIDSEDYGPGGLRINGLEVLTNRKVFHNGGNGPEKINCPDCKANIIESDWGEALEEWVNDTGNDEFICSECSATHSITAYKFEPKWGFGNLGFTFWNWPVLKKEFISEVEQITGSKVTIVYGRI